MGFRWPGRNEWAAALVALDDRPLAVLDRWARRGKSDGPVEIVYVNDWRAPGQEEPK